MNIETISYPAEAHGLTREIEDSSYWYRHRNELIGVMAEKFISKDQKLYDWGGGNGVVAAHLQQLGYQCTLVEALPDAVIMAKSRGIDTVVQLPIQQFTETALDAIMLFDVIEHIEDDVSIIKQAYQQLKPKGFIIITVPAFYHLKSSVDDEIGHYRRYTTRSISEKLKTAGFSIEAASYFFSILYFPLFIFRVIPEKLFSKRRAPETRRKTEHLSNKPVLNRIIKKLLQWECYCIQKGIKIPLGTSCIIVAKK